MPSSLKETWFRLTVLQRAALIGVLALVFGGILTVSTVMSRPKYGVVFSNLTPEDAGQITSKLRDQKIEYRLTNEGRSIEVPEEKVYDVRLEMASAGLPSGGTIGFELFDKSSFGATDFTQHVNYKRALAGELQRTINGLEGVEESRVLIALPEKRLFQEQQEEPSASVQLRLRPGYRISERQVAGITHLVSAAVEGMKPESVRIHDGQGQLLSSAGEDGANLTGNQLQLQERYEKRMEGELTRLADQVLGPDKAAIRVSAELNWDQTETSVETYKGAGRNGQGIPLEESNSSESYEKQGAVGSSAIPASGAPGVTSNTDPNPTVTPQVTVTTRPGQYVNSRINNRYAVNKTIEKRVSAPGQVKKVSVAVLLDGEIDATQQNNLRKTFAAAAGLDLAAGGRGDRIELLPMKFDRTAETAAAQAMQTEEKKAATESMVRNGAAVGVVALLLVGTLILAMRLRAPRRERLDVRVGETAALTQPYSPVRIQEEAETALVAVDALDASLAEELKLPPLELVKRMAAERPEEVARHLELWIKEEVSLR